MIYTCTGELRLPESPDFCIHVIFFEKNKGSNYEPSDIDIWSG